MDNLILKTLQLVYSSKRMMPAHFCSDGDRNQTFFIDFKDLTKEDDHIMASESWGHLGDKSFGNYEINGFTEDQKEQQIHTELICGENIMVGSFILTKLGGEKLLDELEKQILKDSLSDFSEVSKIEEILRTERAKNYFKYCKDFGHHCANIIK
ncbi:MAG: hypothetical protein WCI93_03695 [bacterium]